MNKLPIIIACSLTAAILAFVPVAASAQTQPADTDYDQVQPPRPQQQQPTGFQGGRVGETLAGEVGQRQTREQVNRVSPIARIASRIQNRIQSRISNRIDRNYDPQAGTTTSFATAEDRARSSNARPR